MKLYMPQSFFTLLLTGFLFVSMPLIVALYSSMQILDILMLRSDATVFRSVEMKATSGKLADLLVDEERKARMYNVLRESAQLQEVNKTHEEIVHTLNKLNFFDTQKKLQYLVKELKDQEYNIIAVLNNHFSNSEQNKEELKQILDLYQDITNLSVSIAKVINQMVKKDVEVLKQEFSENKKKLAWETTALLSFNFLLIVVFMTILSNPVRQINNSIELLGDGNFSTPMKVSGPKDLQNLGKKLDWLRKRLIKLEKEKTKLIAHISHDLKTPLASLKEGISLLSDEIISPMEKDQKEVIRILDKNCAKLQKLIENILSFNLAQAKELPFEKSHIKLNELLNEVVSDHRNSIISREIKLDIQFEKMTVLGSFKKLKTVFDNLLSNAVKFSSHGGIISLKLEKVDNVALFHIVDSGPGIDEEDRLQIFSPFFKGKSSEKTVIRGSGLGLAISKEYLQIHEGTIRLLESKKGAHFLVTLPISECKRP